MSVICFRPAIRLTFALSCIFSCLTVHAFTLDETLIDNPAISQRFPSGSINSAEKANRALEATQTERTRIEQLSQQFHYRCGENFLVNSCRDDVRRAKLRQERRLTAIEQEARNTLRKFDAQEYEARVQENTKKSAQSVLERASKFKGNPDAASPESDAIRAELEKTLTPAELKVLREQEARQREAYQKRQAEQAQKAKEAEINRQRLIDQHQADLQQIKERQEKHAQKESEKAINEAKAAQRAKEHAERKAKRERAIKEREQKKKNPQNTAPAAIF